MNKPINSPSPQGGPSGPLDEKQVAGRIDPKTVLRFLKTITHNRRKLWGGVLFLAMGSLCWPATSLVSGNIADRIEFLSREQMPIASDPKVALWLGLAAVILFLMYCGNRFGRTWFNEAFILAMSSIHREAFTAVLDTHPRFFYQQPSGRIVSRFSGDFNQASFALERILSSFIYAVLAILFSTVMVIVTSPLLALISVPFCILLYIVSKKLAGKSRDLQREVSRNSALTMGHVTETISGGSVLRPMGVMSQFQSQFRALQKEVTQNQFQTLEVANLRALLQSLLTLGLISAAMWYGLRQVENGQVTIGTAGANLTLLMLILRNFIMTVELLNMLETAFTGVERLGQFADLPKESQETGSGSGPLSSFSDTAPPVLVFQQARSRYAPDLPWVLKGVTAQVEKGELIGVVGRTGSGKSTLMMSLLRMIELEKGGFFFEGEDLLNWKLDELRKHVAVVPQDPILFAGTLMQNLFPDLPKSELESAERIQKAWEVLEKTHLKAWVDSLPEQLNTSLSARGQNLSQGQRQLLCLARALVRDPSVLILDEATSSVDPETEKLIERALEDALVGVTGFVVAHRLGTVKRCSRIWVMADGELREDGAPHMLLENPQSEFSKLSQSALAHGGILA